LLRRFSMLVLATASLFLTTGTRGSPGPSCVNLSYSENPTYGEDFPRYRVDFGEGGWVEFNGLSGCVVPGVQSYRIPEAEFQDLVRAFKEAHFFNIPRLDPNHMPLDATITTVTYKDARRIHETLDVDRPLPRLIQLENRLRAAANVDRFVKPSVSRYEALLGSGWDVNTVGQDHENALTAAVWCRDLDSTRFLSQHGASVSNKALQASLFSRNPKLTEFLLDARRIDMKSAVVRQLLTTAVRSNVEVTRLLLKRGADVNFRDPASGETPLTAAIYEGSLESATLLVVKGADVNLTDNSGRSPLALAATQDKSGFVTLLSQHGARVNARDASGETTLMVASEVCAYWNIRALLAAGADPTITDKDGHTVVEGFFRLEDENCKLSKQLLESALRNKSSGRN
jgi:ankyrin repeat protein